MEQTPGMLDRRFQVPEHVVTREFADETVLLSLTTGGYHTLNPVASRVVSSLGSDGDPRTAIEAVLAEWRVERARVERDVIALFEQLLERGLIEDRDSGR